MGVVNTGGRLNYERRCRDGVGNIKCKASDVAILIGEGMGVKPIKSQTWSNMKKKSDLTFTPQHNAQRGLAMLGAAVELTPRDPLFLIEERVIQRIGLSITNSDPLTNMRPSPPFSYQPTRSYWTCSRAPEMKRTSHLLSAPTTDCSTVAAHTW